MKYNQILIAFFSLLTTQVFGQNDSSKLKINGYVDTYFAAQSNQIGANELQPYLTTSPRNERFGVNIAQIGVLYAADKIRGAATLHYGDIAKATWSTEFPAIQEAWMGTRLAKDLWFDAGFFITHIGTESFLPKNNLLSSTAVATFNEPFFQSGARLSYEKDKLTAQLHVVSGYNFFLDINNSKSVGVLLSYELSNNLALTYTNLYGKESPDSLKNQFRFYQNLYANWTPTDKIELIIGGDLGTQTNSQLTDPSQSAMMYNALATFRYKWTNKFSSTIRYEIFSDPEGFISGTLTNVDENEEGLSLRAFTLGLEYAPTDKSYLRAETRWLQTKDSIPIFTSNETATNRRTELSLTMGFYFSEIIK